MIQIEKAKPSDAAELTQLTRVSKAHWGYSKEQMERWKDDLTVSEDYIEKSEVYLTKIDNSIAGYFSYSEVSPNKVKLDNIFISPTYIGTGLGKQLMTDFINRIKETSYQEITLDAEPNAEAFYKRFGFETVDQLESSIPGRALPIMVLPLDK